MTSSQLSGLQRDVLAFYRRCLRMAARKPEHTRHKFQLLVRSEFRRHQALPKTQIGTIEYLLRQGRKRFDVLSMDSVRDVEVHSEGAHAQKQT